MSGLVFDYKFYITKDKYDILTERCKKKNVGRKTRYKMDLYLMNGDYFYTCGFDMATEFLIATNMLVNVDIDKSGLIFVDYRAGSNLRHQIRFIIRD